MIKHLKGSLFAPASFKGSPVSGFLQVLEHFNELVIWLHSSEELICQLFTFFSLTTPKAKKKKKKRWKCELFSQLSLAGRCMLWASQALQDFLFSGCCSHKHSRPPVAVVDIIFAFLFLQQRDNIWGPFLIISPASTLNNWHQEFTRFVPKFKVRNPSWLSEHTHTETSAEARPKELLIRHFCCSSANAFLSPLLNAVVC